MATLSGIDLGDIQSEEHTKDSGIFNQPLPRQDSDTQILLDLFGVTRQINLSGILVGTESEQKTFIGQIEGICDGIQNGSAFVSSLITSPSSYNVLIQTFTWSKNAADLNKLNYNLTLMEGAAVEV